MIISTNFHKTKIPQEVQNEFFFFKLSNRSHEALTSSESGGQLVP